MTIGLSKDICMIWLAFLCWTGMSVGVFEGGVGQDRWQIGLKLFLQAFEASRDGLGLWKCWFRDTQMLHAT